MYTLIGVVELLNATLKKFADAKQSVQTSTILVTVQSRKVFEQFTVTVLFPIP